MARGLYRKAKLKKDFLSEAWGRRDETPTMQHYEHSKKSVAYTESGDP